MVDEEKVVDEELVEAPEAEVAVEVPAEDKSFDV